MSRGAGERFAARYSGRLGDGRRQRAHAAFTVGRQDDYSIGNIVDEEALNGYVLGLGFGWPLGAVAPFARVRYVELSADHTTYRPLLFNVGVLFQSW